ncbi:hypothetical protein NMD14_02290 [Aeromonas veronii]
MIGRLCSVLFLLLLSLPAQAALDCNSIFPGPIQSHDADGALYMQSGARVENYNGLEVCFKRVTGYDYEMNSQACGTGKCQITGVASLKQTRPTFPGSTDSASYTVANWTIPTVILGTTPNYGKPASGSRWDLGNLTIDGSVGANGSGNVSFSDSYTTYVIKNLTMQDRAVMTLTAGKTYIIEGDLNLTGGSIIKLVGSGTTLFYVRGNVSAHNDSQLQTGVGFKVYVVGNLTLTGSDQLAGTYYAEGDATFENGVVLRGQLSAKNVSLKGNSKVIYEAGFSTCKNIFTDPPVEGVSMTPPSGVLVPPLADLVCSKQGSGTSCTGHSGNRFGPGDYDFGNGSINNQAEIVATGVTARLYFNNLNLNNARLNLSNPPEHLFIYVKGDLSITGQNQINAVVYVAGNVHMAGNATLKGALATGGSVNISGNHDYYFDQDAVDKVDLGSNTCEGSTGGTQINHFELSHSGQPLTCNSETVTVKACADAACTTLITDPVTATLSLAPTSASNGWVGGNTVTFSGGSTTVPLRNNTTTAVTIGVSSSTPTTKPYGTTLCKAGAGTPSAAACTLNFADSGFIFDVPDTYSNQPQDVTISAVKKDDITKQCVPGFTGVRSVGFWGTYNNPNANNFGSKISIDGNTIATYATSIASPTPTTLNLTFDNQGKATLKKVTYPDAGQMQLSARHNGSGETAGLVMLGSDQFVARPVGLCITPPQGVCAAGDSSCHVFKKAGDTFQIDIKAMAWESANDGDICTGNQTTPNFVLPNIALGSTLVAPNPGTNATLGTTTYNHVAATNSINSVSQTVSEVGVFRMTATPPANGYFNYTIPSAQSQPVGRFVPWDFNLLSGALTPACGQFSYMSQPFGVKMTVQARNKSAGVTRNYGGEFAKGLLYLVAGNNHDGVDRTDRVARTTFNWVSGEANVDSQSRFARLSEREPALTVPEEPFKSLRFGLLVVDEESPSVSFLADTDLNPSVKNGCTKGVNCNARQLTIPTRVDDTMTAYYGRLLAGKDRGIDSANLPLKLLMQRFDLGGWVINDEDNCTQLSLANSGFDPLPAVEPKDPDRKIGFNSVTSSYEVTGKVPPLLTKPYSSTLTLSGQTVPASSARAKQGEIVFHFGAPNVAVRIPYKVDLAKQPSSPTWLSDPISLQGEAIFGSSRGNDRIIYRREVLH